MNNTIILKKGEAMLSKNEWKSFKQGDTIWGYNSYPEEIKRWDITDEDEAGETLNEYKCSYSKGNLWHVEEYALEYCKCDEEGEFIEGSDYNLAKEEILSDFYESDKKELVNLFKKGFIETKEDAKLFWSCHNDGWDQDVTIRLCYYENKDYTLPRVEVYVYDEDQIDDEERKNFIQVSDEDFIKLGDKCRFYYKDNDFESFEAMLYVYNHEDYLPKMTIQHLREQAGFTRAEFARKFEIPLRTVENWETGKRQCPIYTENLIKNALFNLMAQKQS